jgi:hypothetical protein
MLYTKTRNGDQGGQIENIKSKTEEFEHVEASIIP